jgi:hypothetical protein
MPRNCQAKIEDVIEKTKRPPSKCYGCSETGHIHRYCPVNQSGNVNGGEDPQASSSPIRKANTPESFWCYNCGEEGHISRNCTVQVAEEAVESIGATPPTRDYAGRNKHYGRAQHDRKIGARIDTYDFGGGLKTCDREVKTGERTRTGLII